MNKLIFLILAISFFTCSLSAQIHENLIASNDNEIFVKRNLLEEYLENSKYANEKVNLPPPDVRRLEELIEDIEQEIFINNHRESGRYETPNAAQEFEWRSIVRQMIEAALSPTPTFPGITLSSDLAPHYRLGAITDPDNSKTYWILMETSFTDFSLDPALPSNDIERGWGTFIIDPNADRELFIQAPHPIFDVGTPQQAITIFKETNSRAFFMAGAHRWASLNCSSVFALCDNTAAPGVANTNNCSSCNCPCGGVATTGADGDNTHDQNGDGETDDDDVITEITNYRETDATHETHSAFHWTIQEFDNIYTNYYGLGHNRYYLVLQFHGQTSCRGVDVFMSYGHRENSVYSDATDILHQLRNNLCVIHGPCDDEGGLDDTTPIAWEVKLASEPNTENASGDACTLYAERNVQGRFLNGLNPETYSQSQTEYSGKFIHIEQAVGVYRQASNWTQAIINTFPTSLFSFSDPHWSSNINGDIYRLSNVGIGTDDPARSLDVNGIVSVGHEGDNSAILFNANNNRNAIIGVQDDNEQGFFVLTNGRYRFSVNQNGNVVVGGSAAGAPLQNNLANSKLDVRGSLTVGNDGDNSTIFLNANNDRSARIGVQDDNEQGFFVLTNGRYRFSVNQNGNVIIGGSQAGAGTPLDNNLADEKLVVDGNIRADEIIADVKGFSFDHPHLVNKEIRYLCIEGPEAAAYSRGTTKLQDGFAHVLFPEHFKIIANPKTMTVTLTPLSANSKGLAVVEKSEEGFKVTELLGGSGEYEFDWEVKCVRKGYEDFKIIRDKKD